MVAVGLGDSAKVEKCLEHIVNSACRVVHGLWTYKFDHRRMAFKEMPTVLCKGDSDILWPEFEVMAEARKIQIIQREQVFEIRLKSGKV